MLASPCRSFCHPCIRSWCRAWSRAWICVPLHLGQRINIDLSCVVPLGTLPSPPPTEAAQVVSLTVVASPCLGVIFAPTTASFFEPVGREELRRHWRQLALGRPPQPRAVWNAHHASVEMLCSRLLWLDLFAMGRGLDTTNYAAAQVWYHAELEGVSPAHLPELEGTLQRTADSQPPRQDGAATS
jgi:hypothetical protein